MSDILYPLYNDKLFSKAKRLDDYEKLKKLYISICKTLENSENDLENQYIPRNPRQDIQQRCNKDNVQKLVREKLNLERKMAILEEAIKKDIEDFKNE